MKRNRHSRGPGNTVSAAMAKRLIRLFGFAIHDAPGEAEAECALLQREGVVDAVLSEDVDTIMFGCGRTLRNWSAADVKRPGTSAVKPPTHVSVYDVDALRQQETGLDREGMVLVALMSGGDYCPEGVPGCGVKVACEAARAGFGRRLCRIKRADEAALREWREDLRRELRTNESKFFRVKHKALNIPDDFPDMEVLRYYTHPVVSQRETVERVREEMTVRREIDVVGLRAFAAETYDWSFKIGAIKFIRVLGPALLVQKLMSFSQQKLASDDPDVREQLESKLVKAISLRRTHASTDATPELRLSYIPNDIVGIDLDAEEDEVTSTFGRSGLALNSDDEGDEGDDEGKRGPKKLFDPYQPDLVWVPEVVAEFGVPLKVQDWKGKKTAKKSAPPKKSRNKPSGTAERTLDKFLTTTKPNSVASSPSKDLDSSFPLSASQPLPTLPSFSQSTRTRRSTATTSKAPFDRPSSTAKPSKSSKGGEKASTARPSIDINPWSIASSQTTPRAPRVSKPSDINKEPVEAILISSSPTTPTHSHSPPAASAERSSPLTNNAQKTPLLDDPFTSCASVPLESIQETPSSITNSPRKHNLSTGEATCKPAAKRSQRTRATSPTRRPTRASKAVQQRAQPSIKGFARLSKRSGALEAKPSSSSSHPFDMNEDDDDDDDDELEDIFNSGPKKQQSPEEVTEQNLPLPSLHADLTHGDGARMYHHPSTPKKLNSGIATAIIEIPSSPTEQDQQQEDEQHQAKRHTSPSPFNSPVRTPSPSKKTTRIYVSHTSSHEGMGAGFIHELEVTREEADRMMREEEEGEGRGGRRVRMWRESDVSILDLTGDD